MRAGFEFLVMSTACMKYPGDFATMNKIHGECFKCQPPARASVVARLPHDASIGLAVIVANP